MSYLLKALEKAELERKQNNVSPEVVQSTVVVSKGLPASVIGVVIAAILLMFWKLIPDESVTSAVEQEVIVQSTLVEPVVNPIIPASEKIKPATALEAKIKRAAVPDREVEVAESVVYELPQNEIKQLEQLSKAVLRDIPSLQLESHIYSSAEDYRSVVINGRSFKQGQFVSTDVVLEKITEDGIVINVANQRIALPKGISWVASNAQ